MLLPSEDAVLFVEETPGPGPPIVFVHGSWDDHRTWAGCSKHLAGRYRLVTYDRRGHSASTAPERQGHIADDVDDLVRLLTHVGSPAVLVGHSYGATVCLLTLLEHPSAIVGAVVHEPPLFAALKDHPQHGLLFNRSQTMMAETARLIERGEPEAAVQLFVDEVGFGPGSWTSVFNDGQRRTMIANAHTWLDQYRDPDRLALDPARLAQLTRPLLVTRGPESPSTYGLSLTEVLVGAPHVATKFIEGAGHAAPLTHPAALASVVDDFISRVT